MLSALFVRVVSVLVVVVGVVDFRIKLFSFKCDRQSPTSNPSNFLILMLFPPSNRNHNQFHRNFQYILPRLGHGWRDSVRHALQLREEYINEG